MSGFNANLSTVSTEMAENAYITVLVHKKKPTAVQGG